MGVISWCKANLFKGIKKDLRRRLPLYGQDWRDGLHFKILASIVLIYFSSIGPAVTFGAYLNERTNAQYGVVEVLLSTALTGVVYALIAGQPMVVVGVTGPVSIFLDTMYKITKSAGFEIRPFFSWICIWSGVMHLVLASFNVSSGVKLVTRFSCEVFGALIGVIYIVQAVTQIVSYFGTHSLSAAQLSLLLALSSCMVALLLSSVRNSTLFTYHIRTNIADYAMPLAVVVLSALAYVGHFGNVRDLPQLPVQPSFETTSGKAWLVKVLDLPTWAIFAAIGPALLLTTLFFFDHNVSSLLSQQKEFHLSKPSAYHWDFACIGLLFFICAPLGLPPVNGLIPQAPLHVRSCAKLREEQLGNGHKREVYESVYENRISPFAQAALIGVTLVPALLGVLAKIPQGVLSGLFLFMGFESFRGNQFFERMLLFITDPTLRPPTPYVLGSTFRAIAGFTLLQLLCWAIVYGITWGPYVAMTFPIFILALVPLRRYVLPKFFDIEPLLNLDPEE